MDLLHITLVGLIAGVLGTGAGGLIAVFTHRRARMSLGGLLGFSAGVMLAVVFHELIPEALEGGGFGAGMAGVIFGALLMLSLDRILPHIHLSASAGNSRRENDFIRSGLLLGLGIALHNFPEGLAIGTSYAYSAQVGLSIAAVLAVHNLPEGMAMAIPLSAGNVSSFKVWICTLAAGLPMGVGALLGGWIGTISGTFLGVGLGFAAGAMLYIVCHELIPGAQRRSQGYVATFGIVFGVLLGIALLGH
ncbi:MAG: ZIP family metal transporter [Bacillota bacterium]